MLNLGEKQVLTIVKKVDFGVYLAETPDSKETVLLPAKQVPMESVVGSSIEVFLYKDSDDRLIATTKEPLITLGGLAVLTVTQTGRFGAFLDWGLEKELLLPFREQTENVKEGKAYLVSLYIDKSSRLCATMQVYKLLRCDPPYEKDTYVNGIIYERNPQIGLFVAVDNCFSALVPGKEDYGDHHVGDIVRGRVTSVREDGRLNLSLREKAYMQLEEDGETILALLDANNGTLPFSDKAAPEVIRRELHMSKAAFKRAAGHLMKSGILEIGETEIHKKEKQ